ncbi:MAG: hypothetical protein EBV03_03775 [Proteobacteria bacterium]|nr:hypothetical protein [Pseudomonadota bacterium]
MHIDGKDYVDPLHDSRYLVRRYPLPAPGDLMGCMKLLESFERRFLYAAEGGSACLRLGGAIDGYIDELRRDYAACGDDAQKNHLGGKLCVALIGRGLQHAKTHILLRMRGQGDVLPDAQALEALKKRTQSDLVEGLEYIPYLHRRDGTRDIDDVLNEMKGEPYKIFVATFPEGEHVLEFFRSGREQKVAMAMVCMDKVAASVRTLVKHYPQFAQAGLDAKFSQLLDAAKLRVQLPADDPDFRQASADMARARKAILELPVPDAVSPPSRLPADYKPGRAAPGPKAMELVHRAANLIFDIAVVRVQRAVSAKQLDAEVQGEIPPPVTWAKQA